ncbi:MAG: glycosyltransferase family 2 protein [Oscillospiraceae bacterium]
MAVEFTILMPCLNEERTVAACISEAVRGAEKLGLSYEILIADNGSTDSSADIARSLGARVVTVSEKGYGSALIGGIRAAEGKYIIMSDCDMSYDLEHIEGFVEHLRDGAVLVMGNRFKGRIEKGAMPLHHRYFGVPLLSLAGRLRYRTFVGDFHCGIRAFDREKALSLGLCSKGMEFSTELIGRFAAAGMRIDEIPADLRCDGRNGRSHLRSIRDGFRHLFFMLKKM